MAYLAARTVFFDSLVADEIDRGATQIIDVGAGYDARGWRFARPGVAFYELDHPATQAAKRQVAPPVSPAVDVRFVPVDLAVDDVDSALLAAGFDPGEPCHVLVEGVTMYLDEDTVTALWHSLGRVAAPGSTLSANFTAHGGGASSMLSALVSAAVRMRWRQTGEATVHWASRSRVESLHEATGWRLDSIETGRELAARFKSETALSERGVSEHVLNVIATRTG